MRYGTVFYDACMAHNIAPIQWLYLDMVRGLATANESHGYYAHASNAFYSKSLCVSVKTIQNYSKQMALAGWLEIKDNGHRKATQAFNQLYLNCKGGENITPMQNLHGGGEKIAPLGVKNLHGGGEKIAPNNNSITTIDNNRESKNKNSPPPFIQENRKTLKATIGNIRKFTTVSELKEEIAKQEYADHLEQIAAWQKLADKAGYLAHFAESHCPKEYGNAKTHWQDDLKRHLGSAIKYYTTTQPQNAIGNKVSKYYYKVNGSPHKHDNEKLFNMHKANFPNHIEIIRS